MIDPQITQITQIFKTVTIRRPYPGEGSSSA
jgi:hypothetical protein